MHLDPAQLSVAERYKLLVGSIIPRPIAFVSSINPQGQTNLAPYSFFAGVSSNPMTLLFCPANNPDGSEKDSLRNAAPPPLGTGQFVVNLATEDYQSQVAQSATALTHGHSEFDLTNLTPAPSTVVSPPRVAESPVAFECTTRDIIRLAPGQPAGGNMVIGTIVHVYVRDDVINDHYHIDASLLRAIGRMSGSAYCTTRDTFDLPPLPSPPPTPPPSTPSR